MVARAPASRVRADERLLIEAAQKDPTRFADLYENHFDRVYAFIARRVGVREVAEDLTSDVFHKALANLKQFQWRGAPFAAWLFRIAANAITDRAKRAGREVLSDEDPPDVPAQSDVDQTERQARLFQSVENLPEDQRRVVVMRFAEEKTIREIARAIGRSEGAVKQLQFRGLQNLRTKFETVKPKRIQKTQRKKKSGGRNG
jgi:RNA polymerase sigma-70 factor (ECF subfamily)